MVKYLYDGMVPIIERDASNNTLVTYTKIAGAPGGIGGLISSLSDVEGEPTTVCYHDSHLGNVNQLTDNSGSVIQTYDYDAFGNITDQAGSLENEYAYKTKEYSPETGLIFFGARYYNSLIGRFITPDPSGMVDGPNLYIYCWNDPINKIDLWGLKSCDEEDKEKLIDDFSRKLTEALKEGDFDKAIELVKNLAETLGVNVKVTGTGALTGTLGPGYSVSISADASGNVDATVGLGIGAGTGFSVTLGGSVGDSGPVSVDITASGGTGTWGGEISGGIGFKGVSGSAGGGWGVGGGISVTATGKINIGHWR